MARKYMDEEILRVMRDIDEEDDKEQQEEILEKEAAEQNIADGQASIYGQVTQFAYRPLLEGKLSMMVPMDWVDMPLEIAKLKYPYETRPPLILTDETAGFNFVFNHLKQPLEPEAVEQFSKDIKIFVARGTKAKFEEDGVIWLDGKWPVGWFDYTSTGVDVELYNLTCCTSLEHKNLILSFNCEASVKKRWKKVALGMLQTLQLFPLQAQGLDVKKGD